ncbi:MAG: hypothetical protein ACRDFQ_01490 [Anaerolineales bacterium]
MRSDLVPIFRRIGSMLFIFMWVPFTCVFVGMAEEFGNPGVRFAQFVDRFLPGLLTARGADPSPLTSISLVITFGMMFLSMALTFGAPLLGGLRGQKVLKSGRAATARIVSANNTGTYVNNQPLVRFVLEVQREDGSPFQAETEKIVGLMQLTQFQPGAVINVRYDPDTLETAIVE